MMTANECIGIPHRGMLCFPSGRCGVVVQAGRIARWSARIDQTKNTCCAARRDLRPLSLTSTGLHEQISEGEKHRIKLFKVLYMQYSTAVRMASHSAYIGTVPSPAKFTSQQWS